MGVCVFCKIARHKKAVNVVLENSYVMAFLDTDPISDGHTIIIPKKDIRDIHSLDKRTGSEIMKAAKKIADVMKKTFKFDGIMIMEVNGVFQDVPHFHLHVFGRNKNNDIKIRYPSKINKNAMHLKNNAEKMRRHLRKVCNSHL